jgi:hypothetical protein
MTTQTAGFTFPSSSLPNRCFSGALSRNRISSPFLLQTPHAVRISRCTELRPELMATPAHGELLSLSRVAELAGARAAELLPKAVSPPPRDQGQSPLRLGAGAPPAAWAAAPHGRSSPWPKRTGLRMAASARSSPVAKAPLPAAKHESSPAAQGATPRGQEAELRAAVMVANRQGFRAVASVC